MRPLDVTVLCGFLGSGKTTLLKDFLDCDQVAKSTAIIVNEAGDVNIDGAILTPTGADAPMAMLANGCVCCALRDSLSQTVAMLLKSSRPAGAPPLHRLVIETSGLARPGPILSSLRSQELAAWPISAAVLTVYDCLRGDALAERFDEAAAQLAGAHRIVLTKTEALGPSALNRRAEEAHALSPFAEVVATLDRSSAVEGAFAPLRANRGPVWRSTAVGGHPRVHIYSGSPDRRLDWQTWCDWFEDVAAQLGDRLLRFKAAVPTTDHADLLLAQSVGQTFDAPRLVKPDAALPGIVFIVQDFPPDALTTLPPNEAVRLRARHTG